MEQAVSHMLRHINISLLSEISIDNIDQKGNTNFTISPPNLKNGNTLNLST